MGCQSKLEKFKSSPAFPNTKIIIQFDKCDVSLNEKMLYVF